MPGMPTVTRSAFGNRSATCTRVLTKRSGGSGYGVGTRNGCARIVPASSRTEPLMPPPPQSIVNLNATGTSLPDILVGDEQADAGDHEERDLPAVAGAAVQPHQTAPGG